MGGGQVGINLAMKHLSNRDEVVVIEKDHVAYEWGCRKIGKDYIIEGDGSELATLEEAGMVRADLFIAATEQDADNLVACQIAKKHFNVKTTISRVHDKQHGEVMTKMGIDVIVDDSDVIINDIEHRIGNKPVDTLLELKNIDSKMVKVIVPQNGRVVNQLVKNVKIPEDATIMAIFRGNLPLIRPEEKTYFMANDLVVACVGNGSVDAFLKSLTA